MIINVQSFIVILCIDIPGIDGYGLELLRISKGKLFYTKTTLSGPVFWASILQSRESRQLHTADGIKFVEASSLTNLVPRALFPGFGKAPWGRYMSVHYRNHIWSTYPGVMGVRWPL